LDAALKEAKLCVLVIVTIRNDAVFKQAEGMQYIPLMRTLLSVHSPDLSKDCKSAEKLARTLGLPDSAVFQSTHGATLLQLGLRVSYINPKVYIRSLTSIGSRKHLARTHAPTNHDVLL